APPTRRGLTSRSGDVFFNACSNTTMGSRPVLSRTISNASYVTRSARLRLPSFMTLLINIVTIRLLYMGSGKISRFATCPLRGTPSPSLDTRQSTDQLCSRPRCEKPCRHRTEKPRCPKLTKRTAKSPSPKGFEPRRSLKNRLLGPLGPVLGTRSEEHTSELQSRENLVCRLLL